MLRLIPLAVAVLVLLSLAPSVAANSLGLSATYEVLATLNYGQGTLVVDSTASVRNTTSAAVDSLHFNAVPARLGQMALELVSVDGTNVKAAVDDQTIIVPLPAALKPDAATDVRIRYSARLRTNAKDKNWLFAKLNGTIHAYRWVPWLSKAVPFDRPNVGDPFVTEVSPRVRVKIASERKLVYATSGEKVAGTKLQKTFVARDVRDFNFTARPATNTIKGSAAGVSIIVQYNSLSGTTMMNAAKDAVATFTRLIGKYPYPKLRVVESGGGHAMEAPALVWIPRGSKKLRWLVAHEVAHQWFYAVVGNDQTAEPFADEALVTLLTREATGKTNSTSCATKPLDRSIYQYKGCYYGVIYVQGANYLSAYRRRVGEDAFWRGIRNYYKQYAFKLGGTRELLAALDAAAPAGLSGGHDSRFPRLYPN